MLRCREYRQWNTFGLMHYSDIHLEGLKKTKKPPTELIPISVFNYSVHSLGNHYINRQLDIFALHHHITQLLGKFIAPDCTVTVLYKYDLLYSDLGL